MCLRRLQKEQRFAALADTLSGPASQHFVGRFAPEAVVFASVLMNQPVLYLLTTIDSYLLAELPA